MSEIADPPVARQISMNAVMRAILARGAISRADLAKVTGLSKQTISDVVRELEAAGWLRPQGRTMGRPGRSAITYEIDGRAGLAVAIDLGGTKIHAAVGDLLGHVLAERLEPTAPEGGAVLVEQLARTVEKLAAEAGAAVRDLRFAVLGSPGVFHPDTGHIAIAPNIPGLDRIDLRGLLAERLGLPVVIENDVNLAARGEQWRGHAAGLRNFVFVALGTGIGMGIIADGKLLRGAGGAAGEISYLPLGGDPYDPRGFALGTLETAVGSVGIARRYAGFGGREGASVRDIFERFGAGEPAAIAAIEETARIVAPAIAAVGAVLDPEIVILGGSIGVRPELVEAIRKFLPRCTPQPPRVEASGLGSRAALVGGLGVAVERMHDELFGVGLPPVGLGPLAGRNPG
ncbi:MAG TPA: ROK family transcriptional regulator [Devosia sp.]|nr:ROK family transcriptional regulator [Devosia sp.]